MDFLFAWKLKKLLPVERLLISQNWIFVNFWNICVYYFVVFFLWKRCSIPWLDTYRMYISYSQTKWILINMLFSRIVSVFPHYVARSAQWGTTHKMGHGLHSSKFLCCYVVPWIVYFVSFCVLFCVWMCTVLLPPGGYPTAVNKYIYHSSPFT